MKSIRIVRGLGAAAALALAASCNSLDVSNPNEPDLGRALADPNAIESVGAGAFRTWFNAYTSLRGAGVLDAQARSYSSSWNNGNVNFYTSIDQADGSDPALWTRDARAWQNDPAAGARTSIDAFWGGGLDESAVQRGGMYNALSSANDALKSIRVNNVVIRNASDTKRIETAAVLMQGAALMVISLQYDQAYFADEKSDLSNLQYQNRKALRDSAVSKLQQAATLATANRFTTPAGWTNGISYTNVQLAQIANTMSAMTLAYYPRDATEAASQVDWTKVANYASKGTSTGTPVEFMFVQDGYNAWISELMNWFEEIDTGRMSTRVAHLMDPATQRDPWPGSPGNPKPNSPDKRLGNGSFGDVDNVGSFGTYVKNAGAGTDYAWSGIAGFRPSRGSYHQSNMAQIRYDYSGNQDPSGQYGGYGPAPVISSALNDLLWAEALIRQGGAANLASAATLINKTRVTRGGLSSAAVNAGAGTDAAGACMANGKMAGNGLPCTLYSMLIYEKEVELPGLGPAPYWEERKLTRVLSTNWEGCTFAAPAPAGSGCSPSRTVQGLLPGTPREMPITYKELGVKGQALYTWGGATPNSPTPP